ncbi:hypothetical protein [Brooklawnia cerclae]|uniref:hypothetical protein n=1 Tax=Brooklawnia cerclae TaxID=349934 RepID=UPI0031DBDB16
MGASRERIMVGCCVAGSAAIIGLVGWGWVGPSGAPPPPVVLPGTFVVLVAGLVTDRWLRGRGTGRLRSAVRASVALAVACAAITGGVAWYGAARTTCFGESPFWYFSTRAALDPLDDTVVCQLTDLETHETTSSPISIWRIVR